jgi:hypothetical protein
MTKLGPNEKLYPVVKIAMVVDALKDEGVSPRDALAGIPRRSWARRQFGYPANEVIQSYCNAIRLSRNPHFAYQTGLRFHVSTYGVYGFAILSSTWPNHGVCRPISPARCAAPRCTILRTRQSRGLDDEPVSVSAGRCTTLQIHR